MIKILPPTVINLENIGGLIEDKWGMIFPFDLESIPFQVKRIFLAGNNSEFQARGNHAHKSCHQLLVCISGSVRCSARDLNGIETTALLDAKSSKSLYMPPLTWGWQEYLEPNSRLLVFASHSYDSNDYIRKYEKFLDYLTNSE